MVKEEFIKGRKITYYGDTNSRNIIIQPIDDHDGALMDDEKNFVQELCGHSDFLIVSFLIKDWNSELTPWNAEPIFGKKGFKDGGKETLRYIIDDLIPYLRGINNTEKFFFLVGYSLAGLFSLWSGYQTNVFEGVAAVSPSVWYKGWIDYARDNDCKTKKVYLSLGDREEKAKNIIMASVGDAIRKQYELLIGMNIECILEWNEGNHFVDSDKRIAKGINWLIRK